MAQQDTYQVSCRDGRGFAIETVYKGEDQSESYQAGSAHMNECDHPNGVETVSVRTDYFGMAHVSGRWSRVRGS
jgi:hypothetical protein